MSAGHHHGPTAAEAGRSGDHRKKLWIAFGITAVIVVVQLLGTIVTGSLALLTDTVHAITDASGLLVALIAATLMLKPPTMKRTWGFRRIEVIAALGQATLLLGIGVYAAIEGIRRLVEPPQVPPMELLVFGVLGLVANIIALTVLASSRGANLNMRAAFLEVLNDALGSLGVIVAAIVMGTTGFLQADAIASLFIVALIVPRAYVLMRETLSVLMEFTPKGLDLEAVRRHIMQLDHVIDVHDLHASTVATSLPVLTAHIVVQDECFTSGHVAQQLKAVQQCVTEHFEVAVQHSTFQIEPAEIAAHEPAVLKHYLR